MKRSKAQITLFLVLGVILLFVVGIGIYFISNLQKEKIVKKSEKAQQLNLETLPIKTYIDECIRKVAVESAYEFGQRQGYYDVPSPNLGTNSSNIAYYYFKSKNLVPQRHILEREFSKIVEENLLIDCTDFSIFDNLGFNVEFSDVNATAQIFENQIIINVDYPLSIIKGATINSIDKFTYTLPFRVGHIIDISKELVNALVEEPYALDLTLLLNHDVDISVIHYDNCNDVYIIIDNESKMNPSDDDYVFTFAAGFEDKYCNLNVSSEIAKLDIHYPEIENNNPVLKEIPYLTANINQTFSYKLNASDKDNDILFYLTERIVKNYTNVLTGLIKFTPKESDIGIHLINATVVDIKSGTDSKQFYLEIK